ncbi:hypothetical protein WDU94_001925, partial [Cyamophila willieti]
MLTSASTAAQRLIFRKLSLKKSIISHNIWFNSRCLHLNITPNYAKIKVKSQSKSSQKAIEVGQRSWVRSENNKFYAMRDTIGTYLYVLHRELSSKLHPVEFDLLYDKIKEESSKIIYEKQTTQEKKIQNLLLHKNDDCVSVEDSVPEIEFFPRVLNLSDCLLTEEECMLLDKGIKYSPQNTSQHLIQTVAVDVETGLDGIEVGLKHKCVETLQKCIDNKGNNSSSFNSEQKILKQLRCKFDEENIVVTKADKNDSLVLMNKSMYEGKVEEFIADNNAVVLKKDPTSKYMTNLRDLVKNAIILTNYEKNLLINKNVSPPKLYGLAKVHKTGIPIRPVVSYKSAPAYKLAKKSNQLYLDMSKYKNPYSINNSLEVIEKIKDMYIPPSAKILSFDVVNLFPSIPVP